MDHADAKHLREQFQRVLRNRLPDAPIARVALLQHGDDPKVEPGEIMGRIHLDAPSDREQPASYLETFFGQHRADLRELRRELHGLPDVGAIEFVVGDGDVRRAIRLDRPRAVPLETRAVVPVMTRLGSEEIEIVDTLITAGIAGNRAEAIRWALARIRERPAFREIQRRAREIEELRQQF